MYRELGQAIADCKSRPGRFGDKRLVRPGRTILLLRFYPDISQKSAKIQEIQTVSALRYFLHGNQGANKLSSAVSISLPRRHDSSILQSSSISTRTLHVKSLQATYNNKQKHEIGTYMTTPSLSPASPCCTPCSSSINLHRHEQLSREGGARAAGTGVCKKQSKYVTPGGRSKTYPEKQGGGRSGLCFSWVGSLS